MFHLFSNIFLVISTDIELESIPVIWNPILARYTKYFPVPHPKSRIDFFSK